MKKQKVPQVQRKLAEINTEAFTCLLFQLAWQVLKITVDL